MKSSLLEQFWVAGHPEELRTLAAQWNARAESFRLYRAQLAAHDDVMSSATEGGAAIARRAGLRQVLDALDEASEHARAVGAALSRVGDIVEQSQQRMRIVAAVSTFHGVNPARVPSSTPWSTVPSAGEVSHPHENVARTMFEAIRHDADESLTSAIDHRQPVDAGVPGAAPMAAGRGGLGLAGGIATAAAGAVQHGVASSDEATVDNLELQARADELIAALPAEVAGRVKIVVGQAITESGEVVTAIGTSEPGGYLRPGMVPLVGEIVVGAIDHAQDAVRGYFMAIGATEVALAGDVHESDAEDDDAACNPDAITEGD